MRKYSFSTILIMTAVVTSFGVTQTQAGLPMPPMPPMPPGIHGLPLPPAPPGVSVQINGYLPAPPGVHVYVDGDRRYYHEGKRRVYLKKDRKHYKKSKGHGHRDDDHRKDHGKQKHNN